MKRLITLAIMVAFILGGAGMVKAAEISISGGDMRVHGNFVTNPNFESDFDDDKFNLYQRFRTGFNFVANENLKGFVQIQYGDNRWGEQGFQQGAVNNVQFRQAYLDFMIPDTEVQVKAGHQWWVLPNTLGSHIFDSRAPALTVHSPINDMVGVTVGYSRSSDESTRVFDNRRNDFTGSKDEIDHFFAIVPVTMDGFELNPFVHYARIGKYEGLTDGQGNIATITSTGNEKSMNAYWLGLNATVDMFDPIVVHADFNYGAVSKPASGLRGDKGWIANLAVDYNMDMMTPQVFVLYESGESRSSVDADRTGKVMPTLGGELNFTSFAFAGSEFGGTASSQFPFGVAGATGKWALGGKLQDISFINEDVTHEFQVAYYQGTNHSDHRDLGLFTTKDSMWEVNFNTKYQMYENLAAIAEFGYLAPSLDEDNDDRFDDNSFKAAAGFRYRF